MRWEHKGVTNKMCKLSDLAGKSVNELLEKAGVGPDEIPRDLDRLLKGLKIIATWRDFSDLEKLLADNVKKWGSILGAVAVNDDRVGIFYRPGSTDNRIRFTVAHELAHCCLHAKELEKGHILMRYDGYFPDEEEIKANDFASELLMPERLLRADYENDPKPRVLDLANKYGVSINVMEVRLIRLNLLGVPLQ